MRSRALGSTLAALLALAAAPGDAAGATLRVTGQVSAAGRSALSITIELLPLPGGPQPAPPPVRATARPDGHFTFEAPAPGLYRVVVSAPGHQSIEVPLLPLVEDAELVPAVLRREGPAGRPTRSERLPSDQEGPPLWVPAGRLGPAATALRNRGERGRGAAIALSGRVLDAAARQPLAGALVWCTSCDPFGWAFAKPDGAFRFEAAPHERYQIEAAAAGHLAAFVGDAVSAQPAVLLLELAAALAGLVVDAAGGPVAGVAVRARPSGEWDFRLSPRDASPRTASGADGRFRFPRLLPRQLYEVSAHPEDHAPARLVARTPPPGGKAPPLRLVLAPGQTVVGRVVDPDGRPVAAAEVNLRRVQRHPGMSHGNGFSTGGAGTSAATGADGRFRFQRVEAAEYDLQVTRRGFAATGRVALAVPAQKDEVDLGDVVLEPGVVLEGRVVGPKGVPVVGAEVWAWPDNMSFEHTLFQHEPVRTDADGAFRLGDLRRGERVRLEVAHPSYAPHKSSEVEVPPAEPLTIELRLQGTLAVRVVDPDGEPVPGADVSAVVETKVSSGQGVFSMGSSSYGLGNTDREGNLLAHPQPGAYVLQVSAAGFETQRVPGVEVPAGGEARPVNVALRRGTGATLIGRLTDHAGQPLPGFHVQAVPNLESAEAAPFGRHHAATTQTDADGSYRLEALRPGRYEVEAQGRRQRVAHATVQLESGTQRLDLVVEAGVEVSGRVTDSAGRPIAAAAARLQTLPGGSTFQSSTAADGSFVFDWVPDGTYQLFAAARGYGGAAAPGEVRVDGTAVGGLEVRLDERSGAISGQILGLDPAQRSRVRVQAHQPGSDMGFSTVGPDGRYRIADLAPGDWQVSAATDDGQQASGQVTLEPEQPEAFLDLELEARPTLAGRVTFDGRPLAGADVRLSGPYHAGGPTAQDGSFRFGLPPGRYTLILLDSRQGIGHSRAVEVGPDGAEVTIDLESTSLSGRVLEAGGAPIAGAAVVAEGVNPALDLSYSGPATRTDDAGLFELRLAPGHYRLTVSADGFASATAEVELPEGRTVELDVPLAPAAETADGENAEEHR